MSGSNYITEIMKSSRLTFKYLKNIFLVISGFIVASIAIMTIARALITMNIFQRIVDSLSSILLKIL